MSELKFIGAIAAGLIIVLSVVWASDQNTNISIQDDRQPAICVPEGTSVAYDAVNPNVTARVNEILDKSLDRVDSDISVVKNTTIATINNVSKSTEENIKNLDVEIGEIQAKATLLESDLYNFKDRVKSEVAQIRTEVSDGDLAAVSAANKSSNKYTDDKVGKALDYADARYQQHGFWHTLSTIGGIAFVFFSLTGGVTLLVRKLRKMYKYTDDVGA